MGTIESSRCITDTIFGIINPCLDMEVAVVNGDIRSIHLHTRNPATRAVLATSSFKSLAELQATRDCMTEMIQEVQSVLSGKGD